MSKQTQTWNIYHNGEFVCEVPNCSRSSSAKSVAAKQYNLPYRELEAKPLN